jgi:phage terminase large subunit
LPLLKPKRYKGAKGGRSSGKSHFFAELLVEAMIVNKDLSAVCIREIQKSLKFSAKKLIENKIKALGVSHLFDITINEIRRIGGDGICIFQGMQDHTADSIKSLEDFDLAWCEEAQSLSARSIELLVPTIRKDGSEIWFSWNPDQPDDAVEQLFTDNPDSIVVHVNYTDNPFCPEEMIKLAAWQRRVDYEKYEHIWLGAFNVKSEAIIFAGRYVVDEFEPGKDWDGPYQGLDFGFSADPMAAIKLWIHESKLFVESDAGGQAIELDDISLHVKTKIPGFEKYTTRADNSRPDSISYLKRHGLPRIVACEKGKGSVEDGIDHIKSYEKVVIHPRCESTIYEFGHYRYKVDKKSGDVLPDIIDKDNHWIDSARYALEPVMKNSGYNLMKAVR